MLGQAKFCKVETFPSYKVHLLGRKINCMTIPAIIEAIHLACVERKKITVANYNVHSFNLSMQLPWFYNFLEDAEITHCDSVGILKAFHCMGLDLPIQYRVSYTLLIPKLLEHCNQHSLSIFLLGSKSERLEAALENLRRQYPNISVAGHHGYFSMDDPDENDAVVQKINQAKPHILLVGMGMPIQENWIQLHRSRLDTNVIMTGGAVIDRLAGVVSDCPTFISNRGLEWLYRLCSEPKRLAVRYLVGNPAFMLHIALAKFYGFSLKVQEIQLVNKSDMESKNNIFNSSTSKI